MQKEVPTTEQKPSYVMNSKPEKKGSVLRVFTIFFHPNNSVTAVGGAEKRFVEILKILDNQTDLEITVLESAPSLLVRSVSTCKKYSLASGFQGKGWLSTYFEWILWAVKASIRSLSIARHAKPNVILVPNNTLPNLISGYASSQVLRLPLCVVTHHVDVPCFETKNSRSMSLYGCYRSISYGKLVSLAKTLAFYVTLLILKKAKGIVTVSNFTANALRNNGVSQSRIVVSSNAVDPCLVENAEARKNKRIYDGIFVGRISKEKGIFDLLSVWKEVSKAKKGAKLLIVGSGLELPKIKQKISALNLENRVFLRGSCTDNELASLLNSSRIFVFPSLFEGWGIAVAEALAYGLSVVAYDIPALREVFGDCRSVFLVPVKNFDSMTSTILDIMAASEEEHERLNRCARDYSERFTWEKAALKDLELLKTFKTAN